MPKSTLRSTIPKWTLVLVLFSGSALGQFGATIARRVVTGTGVPPASCNSNPADIYVRIGATLPGFYVCLTNNTWTGPIGVGVAAGAGGANTEILFNNSNVQGGITGWTTPNGTTTIAGAATSVLDMSAMTLSNIKFPSFAANKVYGNCTGAGAVPAACSLTDAMIPATMTGKTIDTATATEISYLSGVSSAIQTQLNGKAASNATTTVNGQSCALGGTCTVPFQTNGVGNTSQAGINLLTSTVNAVGLTVTPTNSATNAEKFEITGNSYTGNAGTATDLAVGSVLSLAKGGTGTGAANAAAAFDALAPTSAQGDIIIRGATSNIRLAIGTSGLCLVSHGAGQNPAWEACATGSVGAGAGLATNAIPKATAAFTLADSLLTDSGTALGYSGTGGFTLSGSGTFLRALEGAAPSGVAGSDWLYGDSTAHRWKVKNNSNTADTVALFSDKLSVFAATSSAELAGVLSDETGSGVVAYATSPAFTTDIHCASAGGCTLGTTALPASSVYIGGAGTNNIRLTGTSAAARVITLPDVGTDTGATVVLSPTSTTTTQVLHATATAGLYTPAAIAIGDLPTITAAKGGTGGDLSAAAAGRYPKSNGGTPAVFAASSLAAAGIGSCTNQAVTALNGDAAPTCTTLTSAYVNNTIALTGVDINTSNQVTATHLASALPVSQGGTGATTLTIHGVLLGETTSAVTATAAGATGIPLVGVTGADPAFGTAVVAGGGTGATTLTSKGVLYGNGTSAIGATAAGTQNQFLQMGATNPQWSAYKLPATVGANGLCVTSDGTDWVMAACTTGSVTASAMTANTIPKATGASALANSLLTDDGTTLTYSGTGGIANSSSVAGEVILGAGTAASVPAGAVAFAAPTSVTPYVFNFPSAASAGTNSTSGNFFLKVASSQAQTGCTASSTILCAYYESAINLASSAGDITGTLGAANGGSGIASPTAHTLLVGEGSSAFGTVSVGTTGYILIGNTGADPTWSRSLPLAGSTSGVITIGGSTGTYNLNLPTTAGSAGQCMASGGGGASAMTWASCGGAVAWDQLTAPSGNLALTMAANTSTLTYGSATGAATNMFVLTDTSGNTGTGALLYSGTQATSLASPFTFQVQGFDVLKAIAPTTNSAQLIMGYCAVAPATGADGARQVSCLNSAGTNVARFFAASGTFANAVVQAETVRAAGTAQTLFSGRAGVATDGSIGTGAEVFSVLGNGATTIGVAGSITGTLTLASSTATGSITLSPASAASAFTLTLPALTGTVVAGATSTTATQALFATTTAGAPGYRAIAATDLPATLTSGTAITNAALTTPSLGVATATSINAVAITAPAASATLTIANTKTLTATNTMDVSKTAGVAGAIPWYDTTTSQSATALLAQYGVMIGGGASAAPSTITAATNTTYALFATATAPAFRAIAAADLPATPLNATTCATGSHHVMTAPREYFFGSTATDCYVDLPVPAAGYEFCVRTANNVTAKIHLAALGTGRMYELVNRQGYGTAATGTLDTATGAYTNQICLVGVDSTHYAIMSFTGDFANN